MSENKIQRPIQFPADRTHLIEKASEADDGNITAGHPDLFLDRPRIVKDCPLTRWHPCKDGVPDHGVEVLTYRMARGTIQIGWWDKEILGFIVYGANGTHRDEPDYWARLPKPPLHIQEPRNGTC